MPQDTSGNADFDAAVRERFVPAGCRVNMLPDRLPGKFTVGMTPEQTEFLARHLLVLAGLAREERYRKYPELYPGDAPAGGGADRHYDVGGEG